MKKMLIILFLFSAENAFGQTKWWPTSINIQIPILVAHNTFTPDTTTYQKSVHNFGGSAYSPKYIQKYSKNGDEIIVSYGPDSNFYPASLNFTIDSANKILRNFSLGYSVMHVDDQGFGQEHHYGDDNQVSFATLKYNLINDTVLVVSESGSQCMDDLATAKTEHADYQYYNGPRARYYERGFDDIGSPISDDTLSYSCSLTFVYSKELNAVKEPISNNHEFTISTFLPNYSIRCLFSPTDHSQPLTIYDLLGREVKRIEIPSGLSEYSLPQGQLPSGYYFARLWNMGAKFMVW
jgi:hypothetical protein